MKKILSKLFSVLAILGVLACIGWGGYTFFRENCTIWDGRIYWYDTETVDLSGKALPELSNLALFPNMRRIDIRDTGATVEEYENIRADYPQCEILWDVPFQDRYYDCRSTKIKLTSLAEEDIGALDYLTELTSIDAWQCEDYAALGELQRRRPECKVFYSVHIGGRELDCDISYLELENAPYEELKQYVAYLPNVTTIQLTGDLPEPEQLNALQKQYPGTCLTWQSEMFGMALSRETQSLTLTAANVKNVKELYENLPYFPYLEKVDLTKSGLPQEDMIALAKDFPDTQFLFDITFGHVTVRTDAEEVDFSNVKFGTTETIEGILHCFPNLEKVVMCECDIPSQDMDALNKKYADIRFVWSVMLGTKLFRTDAVYFTPNRTGMQVNDSTIADLEYCVDMVCVDLGHQEGVTHCDWAANMPNLKYLILADSGVRDISGVTGLENLVFLELFQAYFLRDYSPLVTCTGLEDLNLCYSYGDPTPILEMTWLKRLWWAGAPWKAKSQVPEKLPDTEFNYTTGSSTGGTWREGQHYYDMRNFIGMEYMTG